MSLAVAAGWMLDSLLTDGRQETFLLRRHCCVFRARVPLFPGLYLYPVHARHRQITWKQLPSTLNTSNLQSLSYSASTLTELNQGMSSPSYLPTRAGKTEI